MRQSPAWLGGSGAHSQMPWWQPALREREPLAPQPYFWNFIQTLT